MTRFAVGLALLLLISSGAQALGFRGITVHSLLNEPLDARIGLVAVAPSEIEDLRVVLADEGAFAKAGIPRLQHLAGLKFEPKAREDGRVYIHVTSRQAIREPFLDFLISVTWKGVRLVREYTIFLDPPRVKPPTSSEGGSLPGPTGQPAPVADAERASGASYGPVGQGETLWEIAEARRPDTSVTVEQMMMALLARNPEAFQHGNVNLLKQGSQLFMPDGELIRRLSPQEARQLFLRHINDWRNQAWRGGDQRLTTPAETETTGDAAAPVADAPGQTSEGLQPKEPAIEEDVTIGAVDDDPALRVVEAVTEEIGASKVTTGSPSEGARLRQEYADVQEDLGAVREINRDLGELKTVLEQRIAALRSSLEARDKLIEDLQRKVEKAQLAPPIGQHRAEPEVVTREPVESVGETVRPSPAETQQPELVSIPRVIPAPAVERDRATQPFELTQLLTNWTVLGVVALLLLIGTAVILLVRRRAREQKVTDPNSFSAFINLEEQEEELDFPRYGDNPVQHESSGQSQGLPERDDDQYPLNEQGDVASALTEADIFLAYRRYGQAENLIRKAIANHSDSMVLKAKLLEIYAFRRDKKRFAAFMEESHQAISSREPDIWAKVVDLGRDLIPEHHLISGVSLPEAKPADIPEFSWARDNAATELPAADHRVKRPH